MVDLSKLTPDIRQLDDMREVLYDQEWAKTANNRDLYYMYRAIKMDGELRYDITVIPGQMLGKEFTRTKGNKNSENYSELYTVLEGQAIFIMQKQDGDIVEDVYAVEVESNQSIIIPATHYVVMINPAKETLKTANWVSDKNENSYEGILAMKGACYFYTTDGWIKNTNYKEVPELRFEDPKESLPEDMNFLKG